jgi:hypothetical protein
MQDDDIRSGYRRHAALAQLHRWYQIYENNAVPIANALDILQPDVQLKSGLGEAAGHAAYVSRIAQLPKTWRNAHTVRATTVDVKPGGRVALTAEITYLNVGMKPGIIRSADLTYTMDMTAGVGLLPRFSRIEIAQNSESGVADFVSAYPENRARSLLHYWLALIEDPSRNAAPFQEILAEGFTLNFTSGAISSFAGLEAWLKGPGSSVTASTHVIRNLRVEAASATAFALTANFDWEGLLPDGKAVTAETRHAWVITDDPKERFARIESLSVKAVRPLMPRP